MKKKHFIMFNFVIQNDRASLSLQKYTTRASFDRLLHEDKKKPKQKFNSKIKRKTTFKMNNFSCSLIFLFLIVFLILYWCSFVLFRTIVVVVVVCIPKFVVIFSFVFVLSLHCARRFSWKSIVREMIQN